MIFLDGNGATGGLRVPIVFDNLIAKGEIPPMIGIFINPGVLPALSESVQSRHERIFEYDSSAAGSLSSCLRRSSRKFRRNITFRKIRTTGRWPA